MSGRSAGCVVHHAGDIYSYSMLREKAEQITCRVPTEATKIGLVLILKHIYIPITSLGVISKLGTGC
jgi:hypothetical protein